MTLHFLNTVSEEENVGESNVPPHIRRAAGNGACGLRCRARNVQRRPSVGIGDQEIRGGRSSEPSSNRSSAFCRQFVDQTLADSGKRLPRYQGNQSRIWRLADRGLNLLRGSHYRSVRAAARIVVCGG